MGCDGDQVMDLTTMSDPVDPAAAAALERKAAFTAEHVELRRLAAVKALALHQRIGHLDTDDLADAKHWAAKPALNRPMGTGEPL